MAAAGPARLARVRCRRFRTAGPLPPVVPFLVASLTRVPPRGATPRPMQERKMLESKPVPGVTFLPSESDALQWMLKVVGPVSTLGPRARRAAAHARRQQRVQAEAAAGA